MNSYESRRHSRQGRRSVGYDLRADEERRAKEREARRAARLRRNQSQSVGATSLSAPGINALGLSSTQTQRPRGRGETARRITADRSQNIAARPAVYTRETTRPPFSESLADALRSFTVPRILIVIALVVASVVIVFGPARTYYLAWREAGVLAARYEVIESQNEELNDEIDRLQSLEGIEDEARAHGYVYPDEEALIAEGVEEETLADPEQVEKAVAEHEANLPWYLRITDWLFGYEQQ